MPTTRQMIQTAIIVIVVLAIVNRVPAIKQITL